tara:strand:- start:547 stop:2001 length:1455 start_codon:yes stop_codon:yes gene_type:complete
MPNSEYKYLNEKSPVETSEAFFNRQNHRLDYRSIDVVPFYSNGWSREQDVIEGVKGERYKRYPHISLKENEKLPMIGFYQSFKHALMDRLTFMKYGRYVKKFYPDQFNDLELAEKANQYNEDYGRVVLNFARTGKEIVDVYKRGPNSCMGKHEMQLQTPSGSSKDKTVVQLWSKAYCNRYPRYFDLDPEGLLHPVMVYSNWNSPLDLSIAYTISANNEDRIVSRTLCNEERMSFGCVYGSSSNGDRFLVPLLHDKGFEQSYDFTGCRLRKIKYNNNFVVPYLDLGESCRRVEELDDDYLIIDPDGSIECESVNGLGYQSRNDCGCCGERCDPHYYEDHNGRNICSSCRGEYYFECFACDCLFHHDRGSETYEDHNGYDMVYCLSCYGNNFKECGYCSEDHHTNAMGSYNLERICKPCISEKGLIDSGYVTRKLNRRIFLKVYYFKIVRENLDLNVYSFDEDYLKNYLQLELRETGTIRTTTRRI